MGRTGGLLRTYTRHFDYPRLLPECLECGPLLRRASRFLTQTHSPRLPGLFLWNESRGSLKQFILQRSLCIDQRRKGVCRWQGKAARHGMSRFIHDRRKVLDRASCPFRDSHVSRSECFGLQKRYPGNRSESEQRKHGERRARDHRLLTH